MKDLTEEILRKAQNDKYHNMFAKLKTYLEESRHELRNVQWPTRADATKLTIVVIVASLVLAIFLGAFDTFFSYLLQIFVLKQ